jgi:hypothetical protein
MYVERLNCHPGFLLPFQVALPAGTFQEGTRTEKQEDSEKEVLYICTQVEV